MFSQNAFQIFEQAIIKYHEIDDVSQEFFNPFDATSIEHLLYRKCWIDTVQWHYEDIIRNPEIDPKEALILKRKIDASNQDRTDMVEFIDSYFLNLYQKIVPKMHAKTNSESPAWAIDRLSILALKIYHMQEEAGRKDAGETHQKNCETKLQILLEQKKDLSTAIDELLHDIELGNKYMKVYKQMKMYNDESLNPILYTQKSK